MAVVTMAGVRVALGLALVSVLTLSLGACGEASLAERLGMGKRAPDEFAVVRRQPLIIPPDFDLRPPRPGAERAMAERPSERAYSSLTGQPAGEATAGETAAGGTPQSLAAATANPGAATPASPEAAAAVSPGATASPGQSALLAQIDTVPTDPNIRDELAAESGTVEIDNGLLTRLMQQKPTSGGTDQAPTVVRREQHPLDDLVEENL